MNLLIHLKFIQHVCKIKVNGYLIKHNNHQALKGNNIFLKLKGFIFHRKLLIL